MNPILSTIGRIILIALIGCGIALGCDQPEVSASADPSAPSEISGKATSNSDQPHLPMTSPSSESSSGSATASAPFQGTFHTTYQGSQSVLQLEQSGQTVSGNIDKAIIAGKADGNTARGEVKKPETNQVGGTFVMTRKGDALDFQLTLKDPDSGETLALPAFTYNKGQPPPQATSIDPQLVGRWRHTSTYVSGNFSAATDTWLILNSDGSYEYGYSKSGAGGAAGSIVTDRGDADRGKWRANDRHLQYQENGAGPWQNFARYYVEGDTMMLTYPNGSKQIWYHTDQI